jgi:phosphotransferase system IIB component
MHKFIFPLLIFISTCGFGQNTFEPNTSIQTRKSIVVKDTSKVKKKYALNPKTSSLLSAFIPGAGQIYNRKYWKAPIVWGGAISLYYTYDFFNRQHKFWHQILIYKDRYSSNEFLIPFIEENEKGFSNKSPKEISEFSKEEIQGYNDFAKNRKQQVIIGASVFYLFQIVDATVDAHFSQFDVSEDLSLKISPASFLNAPFAQGVRLSFSF